MKKSVIFVISLIYIVSIVIVGFLGQKLRVYDQEIYVNDIICRAEGDVNVLEPVDENIDYLFTTRFALGKKVQITSLVKPDNASKTLVDYYGYGDYVSNGIITFEEPERNVALVTFNIRYTIIFYVQSTDGKNITKAIQINVF